MNLTDEEAYNYAAMIGCNISNLLHILVFLCMIEYLRLVIEME
jgi:hypothetical protein